LVGAEIDRKNCKKNDSGFRVSAYPGRMGEAPTFKIAKCDHKSNPGKTMARREAKAKKRLEWTDIRHLAQNLPAGMWFFAFCRTLPRGMFIAPAK
jgi:hypothetical protein